MSRKTEEINKSIENLSRIHSRLKSLADEMEAGNSLDYICEEMNSEITSLKLWIGMLYKYNGTSRSNAKVNASRENGKKGGRPPKFVTDLKKRKRELEELLNQLHNQNVKNILNDEYLLSEKIEDYNREIEEINSKLADYKAGNRID